MNARDNIKPKTIRLSILAALADGAITTIDDLQIKVGEPRKKVAQNVYPAAIEGLIRRVRDDITGGPAYQITESGREHLRKYADGSAESQSADVTPRVKAESVALGAMETSLPGFTAEVVAQKDAEIASLTRRLNMAESHVNAVIQWETAMMKTVGEDGLRSAVEAIEKIKAELADAKASLELSRMARTVVHQGYVIQRPAKPLVRFTKRTNAETRALSFARSGQRAQVFALTLIGTAVPGAEWKKA